MFYQIYHRQKSKTEPWIDIIFVLSFCLIERLFHTPIGYLWLMYSKKVNCGFPSGQHIPVKNLHILGKNNLELHTLWISVEVEIHGVEYLNKVLCSSKITEDERNESYKD
jgi:hypothetical protein